MRSPAGRDGRLLRDKHRGRPRARWAVDGLDVRPRVDRRVGRPVLQRLARVARRVPLHVRRGRLAAHLARGWHVRGDRARLSGGHRLRRRDSPHDAGVGLDRKSVSLVREPSITAGEPRGPLLPGADDQLADDGQRQHSADRLALHRRDRTLRSGHGRVAVADRARRVRRLDLRFRSDAPKRAGRQRWHQDRRLRGRHRPPAARAPRAAARHRPGLHGSKRGAPPVVRRRLATMPRFVVLGRR